MAPIAGESYRFGPFELNTADASLRRGAEYVPLAPKLFDLLLEFVAHPYALLTKEQLLATVWPDAHVEEGNLTQSVFSLRRRLGQTPEGEDYVVTVPRRGYRFNADVQVLTPVMVSASTQTGTAVATGTTESPAADALTSASVPSTRGRPPLLWQGPLLVLFVAALLVWILRRPEKEPGVSFRYQQISNDGQDKRGRTGDMGGPDAVLATDGSRIYFTEGSANASRLVEVSVRGGETAPIPSSLALPQVFDFSTARSELLIGDFRHPAAAAQLWAVAVPANTAHRIGELTATDAAWSPDGNEIAFVNGDSLFLANAQGANVVHLATLAGVGWRPRWSPDGQDIRLTVVDRATGAQSLWEVARNGATSRPFPTGLANTTGECCGTWTPDGRHFVFQATRDQKTEVWSRPEGKGLFARLVHTQAPVQLTAGPGNALAPVISPDGSAMYVLETQLRGELVRYEPSVKAFLPYLGGRSLDFLEFSRDGEWITYVLHPEGTLWRCRADGSEALQLTFAPMQAMVPRWSPDGRRILFHGYGDGRTSSMYTVDRDGGVPKAVASRDGMNPSWSPDGRSVLFSDFPFFGAKPGDIHVHQLDLDSGQDTNLPASEGLISPNWSPGGRYLIALTLNGQHIMLFDRQAQRWTPFTEGWGLARWSRSGDRLFYLENGSHPALMSIDLASRTKQVVADLSSLRLAGRLAGLQFGLDPADRPLLLRDAGLQEVYAVALGKQ